MDLKDKLCYIRMLLLDVDGVLTDGSILIGPKGEVHKSFNAMDGFGIRLAIENGLDVGIITGRQSDIVSYRAQELGLTEVFQGCHDKLKPFYEICKRRDLQPAHIAYIGDDLFDMPLLKRVGVSFSVSNAHPNVQQIADYVTQKPGGNGAVREVIELILKAQGKWEFILTDIMAYDDKRMH